MRSLVRRFFRHCMGWILVGVAACSSNLELMPATAGKSHFSGVWALDASRSDAVEKTLREALLAADAEEAAKRRRIRRQDPYGLPDPEDSDSGPPVMGRADDNKPRPQPWWRRDQQRREDDFIRFVSPSTQLRIEESNGRVEIVSPAGGAKRSFAPGDPSTLVTGFATFRIRSGWEGNTFVVESRDSDADLEVVERYSLTSQGELQELLTVELPLIKTQTFRSIYKRVTN